MSTAGSIQGGLTVKAMNEAHFAVLRRHMVEVIAIHVDLTSEELGKAALDDRVMAAMGRVPRHRFVPAQRRSRAPPVRRAGHRAQSSRARWAQ